MPLLINILACVGAATTFILLAGLVCMFFEEKEYIPTSYVVTEHKVIIHSTGNIGWRTITITLSESQLESLRWQIDNRKTYSLPGYGVYLSEEFREIEIMESIVKKVEPIQEDTKL